MLIPPGESKRRDDSFHVPDGSCHNLIAADFETLWKVYAARRNLTETRPLLLGISPSICGSVRSFFFQSSAPLQECHPQLV